MAGEGGRGAQSASHSCPCRLLALTRVSAWRRLVAPPAGRGPVGRLCQRGQAVVGDRAEGPFWQKGPSRALEGPWGPPRRHRGRPRAKEGARRSRGGRGAPRVCFTRFCFTRWRVSLSGRRGGARVPHLQSTEPSVAVSLRWMRRGTRGGRARSGLSSSAPSSGTSPRCLSRTISPNLGGLPPKAPFSGTSSSSPCAPSSRACRPRCATTNLCIPTSTREDAQSALCSRTRFPLRSRACPAHTGTARCLHAVT